MSRGQPMVGMRYGCDFKRARLHLLVEQRRVAVIDPQPPLRIDHLALVLDHLRIERQVGDAIALELEHQLQRRSREPVLVDGDVLRGEGVVAGALRFHEPVELAARALVRAVEHHVLEEVRQTGTAVVLVAAADAHPVVQRHARDVVIRPDHEREPVAERARLHVRGRARERARRPRRRGRRQRQRTGRFYPGGSGFGHAAALLRVNWECRPTGTKG